MLLEGGGVPKPVWRFWRRGNPVFVATNRTPNIAHKWLAEFHYFILILCFHPLLYLLYFSTRRRRVKDVKTPNEGELLGWMLSHIIWPMGFGCLTIITRIIAINPV